MDHGSEMGRLRCQQLDSRAELHESGRCTRACRGTTRSFHGKAVEDRFVVRFRHQASYDTFFGGLEALR
ncbi:MAG: hypothetical protein AB1689_27490 [Thermodesulfobacteriota bacterium]